MSVLHVNDASFADALKANAKVAVKYYADWCGSCRLMAPKYTRLSDDANNTGVAFLEVNAEESPEARKLAGVTNLPFFAVFKDGQLVAGDYTAKPEAVQAMIDRIK